MDPLVCDAKHQEMRAAAKVAAFKLIGSLRLGPQPGQGKLPSRPASNLDYLLRNSSGLRRRRDGVGSRRLRQLDRADNDRGDWQTYEL